MKNYLKKLWNGEEKLWVVFWLYFVALLITTWLVRHWGVIDGFLEKVFFDPPSKEGVYILAFSRLIPDVLIRILQIIIVWRSAFNCKYKIFAYASRVMISLFALVSIYAFFNITIHIIKNPVW